MTKNIVYKKTVDEQLSLIVHLLNSPKYKGRALFYYKNKLLFSIT